MALCLDFIYQNIEHEFRNSQLQPEWFMRAPPNFKVSCPILECRMRKSGNSSQRFAPNVLIFQKNVRANLANFIQDLFWGMSLSNKDFKTVEEGLGDCQDLNLSVPGLTRDAAQSEGCEEGSKKICFCLKSKQIKRKR